MSASPAQPLSGPTSVTPSSGAPSQPMRKKAPVSIFNNSKKKPVKRVAPPAGTTASTREAGATTQAPLQQAGQTQVGNGAASATAKAGEEGQFEEYPIFLSRNELTRHLRYHVMKLHSRPNDAGTIINVNPYEESQFPRPVRLHRRFAHDKVEVAEQSDAASGIDDKEREMMNARRAERQAEREENQKLIAPTGGETAKPNKKKPQKKVEEGRDDNNPIRKKRQQLRYEEARPWHLEDFESKNVWVGSYEEPLSEQSILFSVEPGGFQMVPIEKWYKFIQTNKAKTMDSEAIEKFFNKKVVQPRWALGTQVENDTARREEHIRRRQQERQARQEEDDAPRREDTTEYNPERDAADDWGVEGFSDDEGDMELGDMGDDDVKEGAQRLKENQLQANLGGTGIKDEDRDLDEEEKREKAAAREEKKKAKRMRKQLRTHERRAEYDDDSDHGFFSTESDTEDDEDEETLQQEEQKKEEQRKAGQANGDKGGATSKGTNTPSGRSEKRDQSRMNPSLGKRAGSPDASDMSGNESSRKRVKSLNGRAISTAGSTGARSLSRKYPTAIRSISPIRSHSKADAAKVHGVRAHNGGSGSGSDTDTSRAGRPKIRLKNSPPGSPPGSTPNGSRAGSPAAPGGRASSPNGTKAGFPTLAEVRAAIPADGIGIKALVGLFKTRLGGRNGEFIALVKTAGTQDRATQKIMPKQQ